MLGDQIKMGLTDSVQCRKQPTSNKIKKESKANVQLLVGQPLNVGMKIFMVQ